MKKMLLIVCVVLLMVAVVAAAAPKIKLMRLDVTNKTAEYAYLRFTELPVMEGYFTQTDQYITIRPGVNTGFSLWAYQTFTFVRGWYNVQASYCGLPWVTWLEHYEMTKATQQLTIPPCNDAGVTDAVADGSVKLSPWLYPPVDEQGNPIVHTLGILPSFRFRY